MILIQCVDSKKKGTHKGKDLYQGNYFDAMRRYAEAYQRQHDVEWAIVSAKHGLVSPDDEIAHYDEFGLSGTQAAEIATELADNGVEHVELIAGEKYSKPLVPALESMNITVVERCKGLPIGKRVQRLQKLAASEENHSLV